MFVQLFPANGRATVDAARARAFSNYTLSGVSLTAFVSFLLSPEVAQFLPPAVAEVAFRPRHGAAADAAGGGPGAAAGGAAGEGGDDAMAEGSPVARLMTLFDGATPLHCAAMRGWAGGVEQLLIRGADITMVTSAGATDRCGPARLPPAWSPSSPSKA